MSTQQNFNKYTIMDRDEVIICMCKKAQKAIPGRSPPIKLSANLYIIIATTVCGYHLGAKLGKKPQQELAIEKAIELNYMDKNILGS